MLEMLNPTGGDMLRFAAQVLKVRKQLNAAMKVGKNQARDLAVELFCSPPESARTLPDLARLKADSMRFFGWKSAQLKEHEAQLNDMVNAAELSTLMHDGLKVQCYRWKPNLQGGGKPRGRVLLCHGWEGYALNFALLIQKARQAGYEVHAFDHLAHGRSEGQLSGLPIALETLLTVAKHVEKAAGPIDVLVGHSLGGAASSWAVANGAIKTKRLALIAPFYDTHKLSSQWAMAHLLSEEIRALLEAGLEAASGKKFADFMPAALAEKYKTHQTPVLIVHDRADKITSFRHSAELAKLASNVRLHEAHKLGHIAVLADEACMAQIVKFAVAA
jgi:alpha-beta hydrolase superfamily lysophospholipase